MKNLVNNPKNSYNFIKEYSLNFSKDVQNIVHLLIDNEDFKKCSSSGNSGQHHYGTGGLICHTAEVIKLSHSIQSNYYDVYSDINTLELFFAALFHDSGKMFDYEYNIEDISKPIGWTSTQHKRLIYHISRSGIIWNDCIKTNTRLYNKHFENVLHAILSHHTLRELGSPVAPKSRIAWIVTLCDNLSARMCDADSWDLINKQII